MYGAQFASFWPCLTNLHCTQRETLSWNTNNAKQIKSIHLQIHQFKVKQGMVFLWFRSNCAFQNTIARRYRYLRRSYVWDAVQSKPTTNTINNTFKISLTVLYTDSMFLQCVRFWFYFSSIHTRLYAATKLSNAPIQTQTF